MGGQTYNGIVKIDSDAVTVKTTVEHRTTREAGEIVETPRRLRVPIGLSRNERDHSELTNERDDSDLPHKINCHTCEFRLTLTKLETER